MSLILIKIDKLLLKQNEINLPNLPSIKLVSLQVKISNNINIQKLPVPSQPRFLLVLLYSETKISNQADNRRETLFNV